MTEWTSADIDFLRANYGHVDDREIAEALGRSVPAIRTKAKLMCFQKPQRRGRYIVTLSGSGTILVQGDAETCAEALGITAASFLSQASRQKKGQRKGRYIIDHCPSGPDPGRRPPCYCTLHLVPGASCAPGQCPRCGWHPPTAASRIRTIRAGGMTPNAEGLYRLVVQRKLPEA